MPDPAITAFFQKRKEDWLSKKVSASMEAEEIRELEDEGNKKFSLEHWLPDAAKRAGQMSISSHPCTFSHPSARKNKNGYVSSIIASAERKPDGYLRTGNVSTDTDALGNAAALDVYKFLTLEMEDGASLLEHIENSTELVNQLLDIDTESYEKLREGFLSMVGSQESISVTSSKIKQVYFPVEDTGYHLLSILSNSGLIYELRSRVDSLRFSDKQKELRERRRNNEFSSESYAEIYDTTTIGYGGTKPQNISVLNNQFGGKARLLMSTPPQIEKRESQFPNKDFFLSCIRFYDIRDALEKLDQILKTGLDSDIPRRNLVTGRDHCIEDIFDQIIQKMIAVRADAHEQYREESSGLPLYQKIWLCDEYQAERSKQEEWLDDLCEKIARWIRDAYEKVVKKSVSVGPEEIRYIATMINTNREALR